MGFRLDVSGFFMITATALQSSHSIADAISDVTLKARCSDKTKLENVSEYCGATENNCKRDRFSPLQALEPPRHPSAETRSADALTQSPFQNLDTFCQSSEILIWMAHSTTVCTNAGDKWPRDSKL